MRKDRILLCYGDSNTYGFDPRLGGDRYDAENRWVEILGRTPGLTTRNYGYNGQKFPQDRYGLAPVRTMLLENHDIDGMTIMLGTNDLLDMYEPSAELVGERARSFLAFVTDTRKKLEEDFTIWLLVPGATRIWEPGGETAANDESGKLDQYLREAAEAAGVRFVDTSPWNIPLGYDGVHFSEEGHRMFAKKLREALSDWI